MRCECCGDRYEEEEFDDELRLCYDCADNFKCCEMCNRWVSVDDMYDDIWCKECDELYPEEPIGGDECRL